MLINKESLAPLASTKGVINFGFGSITLVVYKKDEVERCSEDQPAGDDELVQQETDEHSCVMEGNPLSRESDVGNPSGIHGEGGGDQNTEPDTSLMQGVLEEAASAALVLRLTKSDEDMVLIQEPWIHNNKICGLRVKGYKLLYSNNSDKIRSCVLAKNNLNIFLLPQFSSGDVTAVSMEVGCEKVWLASAYMDRDKEVPPDNLGELIREAGQKGVGVVLGCDANAHHTIWGSTDINERGELFFDYLLNTNLVVCNIGFEPTFIVKNRQEVLDVTFASDNIFHMIRGWRVAREHSFSDHRYVTYNLSIEPAARKAFRNPRRTNWCKYAAMLEELLPPEVPELPGTVEELDGMVDTVTKACNLSFNAACPLTRPRGRQKPTWWTTELGAYRRACRTAFNKARHTGENLDWYSYKGSLREYKKELRKAQRSSWRLFCGRIEQVSEASRLRKILSTSPSSPSYLIRPDGLWTASSSETLELLMETHFPGSIEDSSMEPGANRGTASVNVEGIVEKERIQWAVNGFKPYKSAGPDHIRPAEIQRNSAIIIPWLEVIFRGCLQLVYIPRKWTEVRVVFIPKSGKSSQAYPKDLRPITLSSFLLKTLERLIDVHTRAKVEPRNWATSQHAYCKGKSVETALHDLVRTIEKSIYSQEFCMVAFLDIEGAFNNVKTEAIMEGLSFLKVDLPISSLINQMLVSRIITAELGESIIRRRAVRGTPQGGVLSPFLWSVVVNELLLELEKEGMKVVAYADDVAIAVSGKYVDTIRDVMQNTLLIVTKWAGKCGLGINPSKTELVLFTKKYKIPVVSPPTVNGTRLAFAERARFLGIILDSKLSWKPNIIERVNKANIAMYSCRNAIGKRWGLKPELVHWLYTAVVRPVLLYGVGVWWPALEKVTYLRRLEKVQRTACMLISGALRTTPTRALEVMLHLIPIGIFGKQTAANVATRLSAVSQWKCLQEGHSTIIRSLGEEPVNLDYIKPTLCFDRGFRIICPSRASWRNRSIVEHEALIFFTDGSKLDGKVGAGVFCEKLRIDISVRLPDYCSVYQAEVMAIEEVMTWLKHNVVSVRDIAIYVDSQAALKSLGAVSLKSRVALDCRSSLNEMSEYFRIQLIWVPGHSDFPGNCRADELARYGTTLQMQPEKAALGRPIAALKSALSKKAIAMTNERWTNTLTCRVAKQVWPKLNLRRTKVLISLGRRELGSVVGILTGHCLLGEHARRLGLVTNDFCRSCMDEEEEETLDHFLCSCPALAYKRHRYLGVYDMDNLSELANCGVRGILRYISSSGWF